MVLSSRVMGKCLFLEEGEEVLPEGERDFEFTKATCVYFKVAVAREPGKRQQELAVHLENGEVQGPAHPA